MLTSDLALNRQRGKKIEPQYLSPQDANYLQVATDLLAIVKQHANCRREELDAALTDYIGTGTDYRILRGLIKLLTDRCGFEVSRGIEPTEIRRALFLKARAHHPVSATETLRGQVIAETAAELKCSPGELIANLYADLPDNQRLIGFQEPAADELIDEYNLAQAQALLYRSVEMRLWVEPQDAAGFRQLFEAIKAYRLIHQISGSAMRGYEIQLTGPVAMFHRSQKYGIQMAVFLPALLLCKGWRMRAEIESKFGGSVFYEISSKETRLRSGRFAMQAGENLLAEKLKASWAKTTTDWSLAESCEVIDLGESAFSPDFVLRHPNGRTVFLEVLGFWSPKYLTERLEEFSRARFTDFILVVSEELRGSRENPANLPANVILCKTSLTARDVLSVLS
jgi:predicted nuclease of restriction endonuclease-like RecB superfamily